ncbi:outer membrane protein [Streptomyces sp. NBRC 110611]|uniref:SpaA isopeptide-forming pilin-related protein n=1 Tax=Streptomyces sp. NBRC 110611 TaxID=1621259 RepID=UPI000835075D|nr:SpaA isopeptide-forming pilin-related protein [Streptomyces sp. NBRC 110611]GAU70711.1 outer membrane protein [Streptomyces sp. NBRC 110611]
MHTRIVRGTVRSGAVAAALTCTLAWAPTATAQPTEPPPSASTTPTKTSEPEVGGVAITTKDPAGDVLPGAAFLLLDGSGQEAGSGKTNAEGQLVFQDLTPGVFRLKEISSGSNLHDTVNDQDVIVTPGTVTPLTITDPFKPASLLLKAKDDKSGKLLAGSKVNIGSGDKTLLTLTTGADGTASGELPINSRTGTDFWAKQVKAPDGYDLYKPSKPFTAKPGHPVTVTVTNAKISTPTPTEKPTDKPTDKPTEKATDKPTGKSAPDDPVEDNAPSQPSASPSETPANDETGSGAAVPEPDGALAHTGADATPWLLGGAGLLLAAGGGALIAARRHRTGDSEDNGSES